MAQETCRQTAVELDVMSGTKFPLYQKYNPHISSFGTKMDLWILNSAVLAKNAAVCSDQPSATDIGLDILKRGGNAADAAVAAFAAVSILQPMTGGIGGDCQCMFYRKADKRIFSLNGSGRNGENATLEKTKAAGIHISTEKKFSSNGLWVTVPGCVAGMCNVIKHFGSGRLTMQQILEPAIKLAENGVPMPYKTGVMWAKYVDRFNHSKNAKEFMNQDNPPVPGQMFYAPKLAQCYKEIGDQGAKAFYCGNIAHQIVKTIQNAGGVLTLDDMKHHLNHPSTSEISEALYVDFHGFRVWEMKPNTIGVVTVAILNVLKFYDLKGLGHNSSEYIHILAEVTKYAYLECWEYLCDPDYCSRQFDAAALDIMTAKIRNQIDMKRASKNNLLISSGNTSYVATVDAEGNGCSFIFSVSSNFGTGLIPDDCGFVLHDRGKCFSLEEDNPNAFGPRKFPLHTIIPSLITDIESNDLLAVIGVIGRWMQPQGQVQVLLNMIIFDMDPQSALTQPRFFVGDPRTLTEYNLSLSMLYLEEGIPQSVTPFLKEKGHDVRDYFSGLQRELFGKGHIIAHSILWDKSTKNNDIWWAGADPRSDGCAMGF